MPNVTFVTLELESKTMWRSWKHTMGLDAEMLWNLNIRKIFIVPIQYSQNFTGLLQLNTKK